jgi:hypothetical protein
MSASSQPSPEIIPYIRPAYLAIARGESCLIYGIEHILMDKLADYIIESTNLPSVEFTELLELKAKRTLDDKLAEYTGKGLIVRNVFDFNELHDPEATKSVYSHMRAHTNMVRTSFFMFDDCKNTGIEERKHDSYHPMFNWNSNVDLSRYKK